MDSPNSKPDRRGTLWVTENGIELGTVGAVLFVQWLVYCVPIWITDGLEEAAWKMVEFILNVALFFIARWSYLSYKEQGSGHYREVTLCKEPSKILRFFLHKPPK